jgi:hypothetical protein
VRWMKAGIGMIATLLGLVWIEQGLDLFRGSVMSGNSGITVLSVVMAAFGPWLLWSAARSLRRAEVSC